MIKSLKLTYNQSVYKKEGTAKFADINCGINATLSKKAKEKLMKQRKSLNVT